MKPEVAALMLAALRKTQERPDRKEHPVAFYDFKTPVEDLKLAISEPQTSELCDARPDASRGKRRSTILRPVHAAPAPVTSSDCGLKAKVRCPGCESKLCLNHARTLTDMGGKNPGEAGHRKCSVCGFTFKEFPTI
jgi:hypothetical protein